MTVDGHMAAAIVENVINVQRIDRLTPHRAQLLMTPTTREVRKRRYIIGPYQHNVFIALR